MQWVETTGRTLDEAKELALDQLGVTEDDAEFDVIEEPRPGLFGRVRGEARVRARVRPTTPRAKAERRDRRKPKAGEAGESAVADTDAPTSTGELDEAAAPAAPKAPRAPRAPRDDQAAKPERAAGRNGRGGRGPRAPKPVADGEQIDAGAPADQQGGADVSAEAVGNEAVRFLDELVGAFGLEGSSELLRDGDELEVKVTGPELGLLIGPRGQTLLAIQELTRVVSQRRLGDHETRLRIDIGGYRERRREALSRFTIQQADAVKSSGLARRLEPMPSADRKVIHDTVATIDGVASKSEGDDPFRRVVIVPAGSAVSEG